MKKLLVLLALVIGGWQFYQSRENIPVVEQTGSVYMPATTTRTTPGFRCDGRQYCSQMHSRAEAEFFLRHCPNTKMDGDRDGVPCENDSRF
ncbi:excalibur calcium-binding domain-containing protein [Mangrovimicrobium sediminis]|uniref:Excalibur calcium-binding domain-containing protein n=2 Tax=Mangrovimicrobium sediminis TaxID=2562682 RepID=A0A4Z0M3T5_9GAMM|nr:excalibur calcium-binding domain-containing protein [Haliea sp. SAOS-164]